MKTLILYAFAIGTCMQAHAQKLQPQAVPPVVQNAFVARFASATQVKWEKEENNYEAEFKQDKQELSAKLSESGTLLEVEREIKPSELPAPVQAAIAKDFAGYKIKEAEVVEANGTTSYEVELSKGKEKLEAVFDANGKLLKKDRDWTVIGCFAIHRTKYLALTAACPANDTDCSQLESSINTSSAYGANRRQTPIVSFLSNYLFLNKNIF